MASFLALLSSSLPLPLFPSSFLFVLLMRSVVPWVLPLGFYGFRAALAPVPGLVGRFPRALLRWPSVVRNFCAGARSGFRGFPSRVCLFTSVWWVGSSLGPMSPFRRSLPSLPPRPTSSLPSPSSLLSSFFPCSPLFVLLSPSLPSLLPSPPPFLNPSSSPSHAFTRATSSDLSLNQQNYPVRLPPFGK